MAIEEPKLVAEAGASQEELDELAKQMHLNLRLKLQELGFVTGVYSRRSSEHQLSRLFEENTAKTFWGRARGVYKTDAYTRKEKKFFNLVEEQYATALKRVATRPKTQMQDGASEAASTSSHP